MLDDKDIQKIREETIKSAIEVFPLKKDVENLKKTLLGSENKFKL